MNKLKLKYVVLSLYALLIVCMGVATIVEKTEDREYAAEAIYGSWWFIALWGLLAAGAMAFLLRRKVHKRWAVFMLHISFVVMLAGALVTHLTAESGTVHLRVGKGVGAFQKDNQKVLLPFVMTLTDFQMQTYPGTDAVMDYRCNIIIDNVGNKDSMSVSMNNIGKAGGYRFYQSAYDSDGQGTQLLVAHDPYGIAITYIGYVMLLVSLLWTLCSRHTRIRQLYRLATKPLLLLAFFGLTATDALGAVVTPVSKEIAHDFGKVVVLYNGRLCPVNTAACEFVTKLSGKSSWNGYSADEIFVSWMIFYTEWERQKLILVKNGEVQSLLGIESKWASVRDFYNPDNTYKLSGKANDLNIPEATRKAIREADEKIQVVTMFYNSEMLRIFPLNTLEHSTEAWRGSWFTPGSTELPLGTPEAEFQFINHAMDRLVENILVNNVAGAKLIISKIKLYQKEKAGAVIPSPAMVNIEVLYNTLQSARWVVFLFLTLSIILALQELRIIPKRQCGNAFLSIIQSLPLYLCIGGGLLYLTMLLVMRWIVSGHVPMSNGYETMLFMSWATLLLTILFMKKIPVLKAFGPLVSAFCMLVSMLAVGSPQITQLMPVLQSPLLTIHVAVIMIAYALLALITLIAAQYIVLNYRQKDTYSEAQREQLTALSQLMLYPAVALLTVGIFVGAVWANVSWGAYWSWDPKETWALITMMIYAVPLHKSFMSVSPYRYHLYILLSFLTVLMTYFGVNYFLTGMHSYA